MEFGVWDGRAALTHMQVSPGSLEWLIPAEQNKDGFPHGSKNLVPHSFPSGSFVERTDRAAVVSQPSVGAVLINPLLVPGSAGTVGITDSSWSCKP